MEDVRRVALALPGTEEGTSYGTPAFRVRKRPFARIHEDDGLLVLWCADLDEKAALLTAEPTTFTTTPHYDGYPLVLVRLAVVDEAELTELLAEAWRHRAPARLVEQVDAAVVRRPPAPDA